MDESLARLRHERSKKDFPGLNLEDGEYVEFAFSRARVCLYMIIGATFTAVTIILLAFLLTLLGQSMIDVMGRNFLFIILFALLASAAVISTIAFMIYRGNQLYITNKHVIQRVMTSPVAHSVNIIDLPSVEDASFHKNGILPSLFNYGTLRLATVGDETTYTFKYSDISSEDLNSVSQLITDAKKKNNNKNTTA